MGGVLIKSDNAKRLFGIVLVNLATLLWASNSVIGRLLKDSVGPITISALRFWVAAIIFAWLLRHRPPEERRVGRDIRLLIAMAFTGIVLFSPILYLGLRYTTAVNCSLINGLAPLITGIFATLIIKEPMSARQISGALAALGGVLMLISGGSPILWQMAVFNIGDIIILISVAIWGLYSVISSKTMRRRSAVSATAFSTFIGLPVLILLALWEQQTIPALFDWQSVLGLLYLGVGPAAIGFVAWNAGVARLGASGAMVFYNTLPVYGALLGFIFLGEPLGIHHLIGGLLIVGGGIWAAKKPASIEKPD